MERMLKIRINELGHLILGEDQQNNLRDRFKENLLEKKKFKKWSSNTLYLMDLNINHKIYGVFLSEKGLKLPI